MRIDTTVSHGDWFQSFGTFGTPSISWLMGLLEGAGINTVHWRTLFGARAKYPSKLESIYWGGEGGGFDRPGVTGEQKGRMAYDLRDWDQMKDVVRIGKEMGVRTSAWYTLYEESHFQTNTSRFAEVHPEYWVTTRDGYKLIAPIIADNQHDNNGREVDRPLPTILTGVDPDIAGIIPGPQPIVED